MSLRYNVKLIIRAKHLRKTMTKQERHLWYDFLKSYPIPIQRQKTIGNFIVDFYCHQAKLVIELDGGHHYTEEGLDYDKERDSIIEAFGLKIMRFSNADVDKNFTGVCLTIDRYIKALTY